MNEDFNKLFPDKRMEGDTNLRKAQLVMLRILKIVDYICRENDIKYWLDSGTLLGAVRHGGFIPWDDDIDIVMPRKEYERFISIAKHKLPEDLFLQNNETDIEYDMPWLKVRDNNSRIVEYKIGDYHNGLFIDIFPVDFYGEDYDKYIVEKNKFRSFYRTLMLVKEPFEKVKNSKIFVKNIIKFFAKIFMAKYTLKDKREVFKILNEKKQDIINKFSKEDGQYVGYGPEPLFWDFKVDKESIFPLKEIKFEDALFYAPKDYDKYLKTVFGDYMKLPPEQERIPHNLNIIPAIIPVENQKDTVEV